MENKPVIQRLRSKGFRDLLHKIDTEGSVATAIQENNLSGLFDEPFLSVRYPCEDVMWSNNIYNIDGSQSGSPIVLIMLMDKDHLRYAANFSLNLAVGIGIGKGNLIVEEERVVSKPDITKTLELMQINHNAFLARETIRNYRLREEFAGLDESASLLYFRSGSALNSQARKLYGLMDLQRL